jgi:hypothetical protein
MAPAPQDATTDGQEREREQPFFTDKINAFLASLGLHLLLLIMLAAMTFAIGQDSIDFSLLYETIDLEEEVILLSEEFLFSEDQMIEVGALSQSVESASQASALAIDSRSKVQFEPDVVLDYGERLVTGIDTPIFHGPEILEKLPVKGASTVSTDGVLGALDRLTHEILLSVEEKPTLVVWLFDRSGSLRQEREQKRARFRRVYE